MSSEINRKLYDMEVDPPEQVWKKLSVVLDEINADNLIAEKLSESEIHPPAATWENISKVISKEEITPTKKKGVVINFRRLAAAAIVIGVITVTWILVNNNRTPSATTAGIQEKTQTSTENNINDSLAPKADSDNTNPASSDLLIANNNLSSPKKQLKNSDPNPVKKLLLERPEVTEPSIDKEKPGEKSFTQPIDDLAMIGDGDHYLTMVNSNGRLVKIPSHLAHLAPHLQGKPVTEDLYEIMFGEGSYWKETVTDWQKKLASTSAGTGDAFSGFVDLMKSVQGK